MEQYIDILLDCIEAVSCKTVIHRMTGDGDKRILIAPEWSGNKRLVLNEINRHMRERDIIQGSKAEGRQEAERYLALLDV